MKFLLIAVLILIDPLNDINRIARKNELKKEAKEAFTSGNYEKAVKKYHHLLDSMGVDEDEIRLNLANAYFKKSDTASAENYYNQLTVSDKDQIASVAYQQLGVIKNKQKKHKEALEDFKQALRKDPYNEEARYNYELLKKLLNEQKKDQDQQQKDQDQKDQDQKKDQEQKQDQQQQDKKDQQDQEQDQQKDQEGKQDEQEQKDQQKKDEQKPGEDKEEQKKNEGKPDKPSDEKKDDQEQMPMNSDKMKELKISEEKAKMILEAMKNQEIQYLQQKTKKAKERPRSDKPDW